MYWDASLENEKVKLQALVKRYATPKTTQRMVNADGKMENVVLPSLFVRQEEHTHLDDEDFVDKCFTTAYLSYRTLAPYLKKLAVKVRKFLALPVKERAAADEKKRFYMADAFRQFLQKKSIDHPYLCQLIRIMVVIPANISPLERFFSAAKFIKSPHRSSLHDETLEKLTLIAYNSPSFSKFPLELLYDKYVERLRENKAKKKKNKAPKFVATVVSEHADEIKSEEDEDEDADEEDDMSQVNEEVALETMATREREREENTDESDLSTFSIRDRRDLNNIF
jgi:hypothetical protein